MSRRKPGKVSGESGMKLSPKEQRKIREWLSEMKAKNKTVTLKNWRECAKMIQKPESHASAIRNTFYKSQEHLDRLWHFQTKGNVETALPTQDSSDDSDMGEGDSDDPKAPISARKLRSGRTRQSARSSSQGNQDSDSDSVEEDEDAKEGAKKNTKKGKKGNANNNKRSRKNDSDNESIENDGRPPVLKRRQQRERVRKQEDDDTMSSKMKRSRKVVKEQPKPKRGRGGPRKRETITAHSQLHTQEDGASSSDESAVSALVEMQGSVKGSEKGGASDITTPSSSSNSDHSQSEKSGSDTDVSYGSAAARRRKRVERGGRRDEDEESKQLEETEPSSGKTTNRKTGPERIREEKKVPEAVEPTLEDHESSSEEEERKEAKKPVAKRRKKKVIEREEELLEEEQEETQQATQLIEEEEETQQATQPIEEEDDLEPADEDDDDEDDDLEPPSKSKGRDDGSSFSSHTESEPDRTETSKTATPSPKAPANPRQMSSLEKRKLQLSKNITQGSPAQKRLGQKINDTEDDATPLHMKQSTKLDPLQQRRMQLAVKKVENPSEQTKSPSKSLDKSSTSKPATKPDQTKQPIRNTATANASNKAPVIDGNNGERKLSPVQLRYQQLRMNKIRQEQENRLLNEDDGGISDDSESNQKKRANGDTTTYLSNKRVKRNINADLIDDDNDSAPSIEPMTEEVDSSDGDVENEEKETEENSFESERTSEEDIGEVVGRFTADNGATMWKFRFKRLNDGDIIVASDDHMRRYYGQLVLDYYNL